MYESALEHWGSIVIIIFMLPFTFKAYGLFPFDERNFGRYFGSMPKEVSMIIKICGPLIILYELYRLIFN